MQEVKCWCCDFFKPKYESDYFPNVITGGLCEIKGVDRMLEDSVCEEFLIRSGLYTTRTIPDKCKNYK